MEFHQSFWTFRPSGGNPPVKNPIRGLIIRKQRYMEMHDARMKVLFDSSVVVISLIAAVLVGAVLGMFTKHLAPARDR